MPKCMRSVVVQMAKVLRLDTLAVYVTHDGLVILGVITFEYVRAILCENES